MENASSPVATAPSRPSSENTGGLQAGEPEAATPPDRDRIAEAYLGRWGTPTTQQRARDRVDWMAANVQGPRILDIGCSQGILALLLARAEHQVLGIDIEPAAIVAARDLVRQEPEAIRKRIQLHVADALSVELDETGFDTVVLGEVIEHLADPSAMLVRAAALLKPGGRLVLTTPFGYFPHPDHRQEFRTTDLVRLLSARFAIDELTIVDGYFRVIAHALSAPVLQEPRLPDLHHLLVTTEEAAIAAQKHLHSQLALKGRQLEHQKRVTATAQSRLQQARQEKSLRQELGRAVEKSFASPVGIFRLPFRIAKAYRRARQRASLDERRGEREAARAATPGALAYEAPAIARTQAPPSARRAIAHRDVSFAFPPYPFPEQPPRSDVRVATILDEFSDSCFRYEAELVRLRKESWRAQIEREQPQFLFVESAWRGNGENWRKLITSAEDTLDNPLVALVEYCKSRGIPTVFWNKEDPPNFRHFIDAAAKFDYVFTTDANCSEHYHAALGHQRVAALPFAAQAAIHNPIGKQESDDYEIAFAGTWYGQKHEERGALLPILLDAAKAHRLHIFDRMSGHDRNDSYRFPDEYAPFLRSALSYPNVLSAYRSFKVFLNVNSVTDSPTMFARRVFEILASSTAVVSTASTGIERMLGDVVSLVHDEEEARAELERLLADAAYRQRKAHLGYRIVMREHTYTARFHTIARAIGVKLHDAPDAPKVSVIIPVDDEQWLDNALANVRRQRYADIEPVWILSDGAGRGSAERITRADPRATVLEVGAEASWPTMLRRGIEAAKGCLIAAFGPRHVYGPEFLGDLALALTYTDAGIVGKAAYFSAGVHNDVPVLRAAESQYRYVDQLPGTTWLARREVFARTGLDRIIRIKDGRTMIACANGSGKIYGADPYNYLQVEGAETGLSAVARSFDEERPIGNGLAQVMI